MNLPPVAATGNRKDKGATDEGFDQLLDRLKSVVDKLEGGKLTLEQSLAAYEEGVALTRRGHGILDQAEKRVELLVRTGPGGFETEPLDATGDDDDGDDATDPPSRGRR